MPTKVHKWLTVSKNIDASTVDDACIWMFQNPPLIDELEEVFEKLSPLLPDVCQCLYSLSGSNFVRLQQFTVLLTPSLLRTFFTQYWSVQLDSQSQKRTLIGGGISSGQDHHSQPSSIAKLSAVESCILGICSNRVLDSQLDLSNEPNLLKLASLDTPTIFHSSTTSMPNKEASEIFPVSPTSSGPTKRESVLIRIFKSYCDILKSLDTILPMFTFLCLHSLAQFCKVANRISSLTDPHRIPTSSVILCTLLSILDVALYKVDSLDRSSVDFRQTTQQLRTDLLGSLNSLKRRAVYHCYSQPLILADAILHSRSIQSNSCLAEMFHIGVASSDEAVNYKQLLSVDDASGEFAAPAAAAVAVSSRDGSRIVSTSEASESPTDAKVELVTNATFRTKVLPEDISVPSYLKPTSFTVTYIPERSSSSRRADRGSLSLSVPTTNTTNTSTTGSDGSPEEDNISVALTRNGFSDNTDGSANGTPGNDNEVLPTIDAALVNNDASVEQTDNDT